MPVCWAGVNSPRCRSLSCRLRTAMIRMPRWPSPPAVWLAAAACRPHRRRPPECNERRGCTRQKVHTREEHAMPITTTRRRLLAGSAAALAMPAFARAQSGAKPRITAISQWSAGSDGAAISALGKLFEERGGVWQHNPVPGFTTEMMNKLRAQIMAGDPPAISQLKGPGDRRMVEDRADRRYQPVGEDRRLCRSRCRRNWPRAASRAATGSRCRCRSTGSTRCSCPPRAWSAPASPRRRPPGPSSTMSRRR